MTKKVRIENADTSNYQVVVETWQKGFNNEPDKMIKVESLNYPTAMLDGLIFKEQYLVIKESSE